MAMNALSILCDSTEGVRGSAFQSAALLVEAPAVAGAAREAGRDIPSNRLDPNPSLGDGVRHLLVEKLTGTNGADAASWPPIDAALLDHTALAVPAFPLDVLPLLWRTWVVDTARAVGVPPDYVAQAVLAGAAGICGAGVWVCISAVWREPLWLWQAAVGAPSSGKSPALASVRRLLGTLETEGATVEIGDDGQPTKRRPPRIVGHGGVETLVATAMANRRGVILWRDEPAGCLAPLVDGADVRALDPYAVTILGALEPDRLAATGQRGEESLAARFLYAWPAPPPFHPLADRVPARDDAALSLLRAIRSRAGTLVEPLALELDAEGLAALEAFLAGLHAERPLAEGLDAAWLGKGPGVVPRLAGVLHLLDWSAAQVCDPSTAGSSAADPLAANPLEDVGAIGRGTVERAVALWSGYYRAHAKAFFDRVAPSGLDSRARRVVRWLKTSGLDVVSREDVRRTALGQTVNAGEADRVLGRLTDAGVLRPLAPESGPKGGRPARRWAVNPALRDA
jgi:hypothetical protein